MSNISLICLEEVWVCAELLTVVKKGADELFNSSDYTKKQKSCRISIYVENIDDLSWAAESGTNTGRNGAVQDVDVHGRTMFNR